MKIIDRTKTPCRLRDVIVIIHLQLFKAFFRINCNVVTEKMKLTEKYLKSSHLDVSIICQKSSYETINHDYNEKKNKNIILSEC